MNRFKEGLDAVRDQLTPRQYEVLNDPDWTVTELKSVIKTMLESEGYSKPLDYLYSLLNSI